MVRKTARQGITLRPHFKTHQVGRMPSCCRTMSILVHSHCKISRRVPRCQASSHRPPPPDARCANAAGCGSGKAVASKMVHKCLHTGLATQVARWFRKLGVDRCTVSSYPMAKYFAEAGAVHSVYLTRFRVSACRIDFMTQDGQTSSLQVFFGNFTWMLWPNSLSNLTIFTFWLMDPIK